MENIQKPIVAWASLRAIHLYNLQRYRDSYAVSQEFLEWTPSYFGYSDAPKALIFKDSNSNKENRTNKLSH